MRKLIWILFVFSGVLNGQSLYTTEFNQQQEVSIQRLSNFNPWLGGQLQSTIRGELNLQLRLVEKFEFGKLMVPYSIEYDTDFSNKAIIQVSPYVVIKSQEKTNLIIHGSFNSNMNYYLGFEVMSFFDEKFFTLSIGANNVGDKINPEITGLLQLTGNSGIYFDFTPTQFKKELSIGIVIKAN